MSPEQAQGKRVDARSDIFAFGALLYEMLTGEKAFAGDTAFTTLTAILRDEPRPVRELAPDVPPELEEVIARSLYKDPARRWQSIQEVHAVLAALRTRYESGILQASQILPPPSKKRDVPSIAAAAALVLALGFGGWWVAMHRSRPAAPAQPEAGAAPSVPMDRPNPFAPAAQQDDGTLTNDSVLAMVHAKVAEPVIVSQIRVAAKTRFDLSTSQVIRLTQAGASAAVLEAMRGGTAATSSSAMPAPAVPADTRTVAVQSGLPVTIALAADIPKDPAPGTPLRFTVKQPIVVDGATVIAAGAGVTGEVAGIKKGFLGLGGKPTFRLFAVDAVDGTKLALRAAPGSGTGDKAERVIEPAGRRDKTLRAPAGTEYLGYIDGAQAVTVRK